MLRILLDSIHEELSVVDRNQDVVYVNRVFAERAGEPPECIVGRKCFDALRGRSSPCQQCVCVGSFADLGSLPPPSASDGPGLDCHRGRTLATGQPVVLCQREDTPRGPRYIERRTFPIHNEKGEVACVLHCVRDLTDQHEMENTLRRQREQLGRMLREVRHVRQRNDALHAQLMQAEKLASLGEMASTMAHELDSPLSTIMGHAEMLRSAAPDEECRKRLGVISQQAARCHAMIRRTLDFARRRDPALERVRIDDAVRQVAELLEHAFRRRHVRLEIDLADGLPAIRADGHALVQVFFNLLRNALDAVSHGGWVRVSGARAGDTGRVALTVEDNGCGLPPGQADRIFEPFYTTKPAGEGTGLGLTICQSIVHAHGGVIRAENRAEGGARFTIELPVEGPETRES